MKTEKAAFAAGCFWGVEQLFDGVRGVVSTRAGYTGGHFDKPTYADVCRDATGHAEAVEVEYDPAKVKFEELLKLFWEMHDPTQDDGQGPDIGSQYRSAIFCHTDAQRKAAEKSLAEEQKKHEDKIVTQIVKAKEFWPAEGYHQKYYLSHAVACHLPVSALKKMGLAK